jgi:cytochrome c oxidase subunit IV
MSAHSHTDAHHDHDKKAPKVYIGVLATLLMLTFITVGASNISFGSPMVNVVVALTIATIKASLVGLFFMHLLHDKPVNAIIFVSAFAFLGLFLIACLQDTEARIDPEPANLKSAPAAPVSPGTPVPNPQMVNPGPASTPTHK